MAFRSRALLVPLLLACTPPDHSPAQVASAPAPPPPPSPRAAPACEKNSALAVLAHDVELEVSLDPPSLAGRGSVRVKAVKATSVAVLDTTRLTLSGAFVGSQPVVFSQAAGIVCVTLPEPLAAGNEQTLRFEWRADTSGFSPHFSPSEAWAAYQTSAWMPTVQDAAQRATLALHITTDGALKVGASGHRGERLELPERRARHSFVLERPSPPFLYAFAVGRYEEAELRVDDLQLRALGPRGADLRGGLEATAEAYRFLHAKLGVTHPWREYLQVFVSADVQQEAAGMALIGLQALSDRRADPLDDWVFMHELAHQWFGWSVACADFADFWLNEGFATFMVGAFQQARSGPAAYEAEVANWRARSAAARAKKQDGPIALSSPTGAERPGPLESELQGRGVTYFRGALLLRRLRTELGEEVFWRAVGGYLASLDGKSARTLDLRRALEAASGRELSGFFARWVYATAPDP